MYRAGHALLGPAAEVALRLSSGDVVADLRRRPAVEVGGAGGGAAGRVADDRQLLSVRVPRAGVAVVEGDDHVAVREDDRVGALVVAGAQAKRRVEEVAEE